MDWIFDNLFIVIIIIAGIYGFLKDKWEKQKQEERKSQNRQNQRPTTNPSGTTRPREQERPRPARLEQQERSRPTQSQGAEPVAMKTVEQSQQEQMDQLANNYNSNANQAKQKQASHKAFIGGGARDPEQDHPHTKERHFKEKMKKNLGRDGLVSSIIMAEVMGPPRAKKPYKSIIHERNK